MMFPPPVQPRPPHVPLPNLPDFFNSAPSERIAVFSGTTSISYGELASRVDALSRRLTALGVQRGLFVGVAMDRSIALIVSLLAIVKSGGSYIPLDPSYPQSRLDQMIASSGLKRILTLTALAHRFPQIACVRVDDDSDESSAVSHESADGGDPLYAIFTSGSTGTPKAASVFRSGFANLLAWYSRELSLGPDDRTLVISSPSFDLSQKNFFAPLATGGTLVMDDGATYDISRISRLIDEHGITVLNCTPSAFYPLLDTAAVNDYAALSSLRHVVLGGEPITLSRLRPWLEHSACHASVLNTYGPTECTDICAFHRLHRGNLDEFPFVPLGREIDHVEVTICGDDLQQLPIGEVGELCIRGAGVGGGYLHDPIRSAECFIDGLYRTGDLARRLPSGVLEFRGRADDQVKVNGFRIELGEIEAVLGQHHAVVESVVTARDNRLTAFVKSSATSHQLREYLAKLLPAYMIPAEIRLIDSFPLTPNGKIDRLALTRLDAAAPTPQVTGSSLESRILALWSEVLDHPAHDATANFFDLGGNSIHLAIIHVKLCRLIGRDFPITDLFALPSARAIAEALSPQPANQATRSAQDRAKLQQAGLARFRRPTRR